LALILVAIGHRVLAAYPDRQITLIIPYAAGGSHDLNARVFTSALQPRLGVPMIIKLVPGQSAQKGVLEAIDAPADGYTLLFIDNYIDQLHPYAFRRPRYDTSRDLVTVAQVNVARIGVIVRADNGYPSWRALETAARSQPGLVKASHSGLWGAFFVTAAEIMAAEGFELRMVPYRGGGPAKGALLAGDVDLSFGFPATLASDLQAGRLRLLATAGSRRIIANVPSFGELGLPANSGFMHRIVMARRKTPADRLETLRRAFGDIQKDEDYRQAMTRLGENTEYMDGTEYERLRPAQAEEYRRLIASLTNRRP
jgi:tripartite-type tricarboxylate transporter receptor subunit TctC